MEEKRVRNAKSRIFWAKTRRWYRYPLSCTGTMMQWAIGTHTTQTGTGTDWQWIIGTGTTTSSNPVLTYFCIVKSRICIPMYRDPNK